MKTNNLTEQALIDGQIRNIINNHYKDKLIVSCNNIKKNGLEYGTPFFIKSEEYEVTYQNTLNNNNYFIILKDQSLLNLCYTFDKSGNVIKHTLSYFPPINVKTYIRIDYSSHSNNQKNHPVSHLHITSDSDNCRIPVGKVVMPDDFLFFVLKYFYCDNSNFVNSLKTGKGKSLIETKPYSKAFFTFSNFHRKQTN